MGRGRLGADNIFYGDEAESSGISAEERDRIEDEESFALLEEIFRNVYMIEEKTKGKKRIPGLDPAPMRQPQEKLPKEEPFTLLHTLNNVSATNGEYLSIVLRASKEDRPEMKLDVYRVADDEFQLDQHQTTLYIGESLHDLVGKANTWSRASGYQLTATRSIIHADLESILQDVYSGKPLQS